LQVAFAPVRCPAQGLNPASQSAISSHPFALKLYSSKIRERIDTISQGCEPQIAASAYANPDFTVPDA
jgi:hypothetical protein